MDRIEPIRPSLPPIDATRVRRVLDEREQHAGARQQAQQQQQRKRAAAQAQEGTEREWSTDEEPAQDEDQDGPARIDVRA